LEKVSKTASFAKLACGEEFLIIRLIDNIKNKANECLAQTVALDSGEAKKAIWRKSKGICLARKKQNPEQCRGFVHSQNV